MLDHAVRVAKAIAAADKNVPGRGSSLWATLSIDEQARYTVIAKEAITEYLAAVADSRTET